ncbi:3-isopropylmalate dehydratase [Salix suchowensis]|nr:3-isopropylmalate dehydratase [Salix suchowensis]
MDAGMQVALPVLGVLAAAAATFYVVSFSELREKSFRDLEESGDGGFESSLVQENGEQEERLKKKPRIERTRKSTHESSLASCSTFSWRLRLAFHVYFLVIRSEIWFCIIAEFLSSQLIFLIPLKQ